MHVNTGGIGNSLVLFWNGNLAKGLLTLLVAKPNERGNHYFKFTFPNQTDKDVTHQFLLVDCV